MTNYVSKLGNTLLNASTLVGLLCYRAISQPNQTAYTFLVDGETEEVSISYQELDQRAKAIAAYLQSGNSEGDRVLLLYQPGLEYIAAFFGCLYAGVIAVPAYPPRSNKPTPRLQAIVADAQAKIALTTTSILMNVEAQFAHSPDLAALHWITTDTITDHGFEQWQQPLINHETLAFVQYTSGSTGTPKGVMLTHGNLLHNSALINQGFEHSPQSQGVIWLPPYHDMGLIGGIIQPLYGGFPVTLMPPVSFLQSPFRWLEAISRYKATTSGGPNFAYELCIHKITPKQRATLDLSSWVVAFNGAEPIRHEIIEQFVEAFAPYGFRREAFYPCYGLAESTLIVSGSQKTAPPIVKTFQKSALAHNQLVEVFTEQEETQTFVGCGQVPDDQKVVIVNPESGMQCQPKQIGEIWVSGRSVAQGYWNRLQETERSFHAYLFDTNEGPFLRTGDLGFLHKGELFVTGRLKDLIIIRGRNHYPQDIEATVQNSHPALRPGCGAAFTVDVNVQEKLVVVQEVERQYRNGNLEEIVATIRQTVSEHHELQVYAVVLLKPGSIPKTSSGKIQRYACRNGFLDESLEAIASNTLENTVSHRSQQNISREFLLALEPEKRPQILLSYFQELIAEVVKVSPSQLQPDKLLSGLGIDSLMAVELKNEIENNLGVVLSITYFLQAPSITQLISDVTTELTAPTTISQTAIVPSKSVGNTHPLSYGQRALWFLSQLAPTSPAYNIVHAVRIGNNLDIPAFKSALQTLVNRHPILRTTFGFVSGGLVQQVQVNADVCLSIEAAHNWSQELLSDRLLQEAHVPFNLEIGPLLRVSLFQRSQEYILLLTAHHIITDFWSLGVLLQELGIIYQSYKNNVTPVLPSLKLQYSDYAHWQMEMLASDTGERLWQYWQQQLAGELPVLNLPTDRPRPPVQTYHGANVRFRLSSELNQKLKSLCGKRQATLYMILLAAFQILLYRCTGQEDILVGSPTAGRSVSRLDNVLGYFVNPVVLRTKISAESTFEEFFAQVRQTVLDAVDRQDYPFALLVERLQPIRDSSHSPLFQAMFILQKAQMLHEEGLTGLAFGEAGTSMHLGELSLTSLPLEQQISQLDLTLVMAEVAGELTASFEYNSDLFDASTIERIARHYQTLLEAIAENPQQTVATLPLLTESEKETLLWQWNDTHTNYPQKCIHELFILQVERTPEAIAVVFENQKLTYRELNNQANQLAHYLQSLGVGADVLVGICMGRCLQMVVAILGILKAGGAYLPLDPEYPQKLLAYMLEDAQVPVLLTLKNVQFRLPEQKAKIVYLDTDWNSIAQESIDNPNATLTPNNLAYVIYTSGSTGKPKGVMIPHRGIVNRLLWGLENYQLTPSDRILQKTSFNFDVAVWEIFGALLSGACLVMVRPGGHQEPSYLVQVMAQEQITLVDFVPAMLQLILEEPGLENCTALRYVTCGGEALPIQVRDHFFARLKGVELHNCYGPTEVSIDATTWKVEPHSPVIAIGKAIANQQVYILDEHLQPVPIGVPGELYVGGAGLALGYLNNPDITAKRFIPNPFSNQPRARLYKTGDLVRYLPNAEIEYLGRIDHQVKIRGFRIELGEIETVLRRHPAIQDTAVVVKENTHNQPQLVAYIVLQQQPAPTNVELRHFLKEYLREYMVPAIYIVLDALPLTPNGKLDRLNLPIPSWQKYDRQTILKLPRNPVEEIIAGIWKEVLAIEELSIHDDFFDLGGHSLLATQVMSRLRQTFQMEISLHNLFEATTINKLAEMLIANETQPGRVEKIACVIKQIEVMSAEAIQHSLQHNQK